MAAPAPGSKYRLRFEVAIVLWVIGAYILAVGLGNAWQWSTVVGWKALRKDHFLAYQIQSQCQWTVLCSSPFLVIGFALYPWKRGQT